MTVSPAPMVSTTSTVGAGTVTSSSAAYQLTPAPPLVTTTAPAPAGDQVRRHLAVGPTGPEHLEVLVAGLDDVREARHLLRPGDDLRAGAR